MTMTVEQVKDEVSRQVTETIMSPLLDSLVKRHSKAKGQSLECACEFCTQKRRATHYIGLAYYPPDYVGEQYSPSGMLDYQSQKDIRRCLVRGYFRERMAELLR